MSEQTKHTPGPWVLCHDGAEIHDRKMKQDDKGAWIGDRPNLIAEVGHFNREANGPLLAAAPELLAACKEALRCCHLIPGPGHEASLVGKLEAAIVRAESRQPVEAK